MWYSAARQTETKINVNAETQYWSKILFFYFFPPQTVIPGVAEVG